ncbi:cysteine hydrolase family protein [Streptomyces profundus]|uniref:cysteine hydrolase family protein n=1 Tax=Streptomyces profundus TaxID=2867410 RepID=UPI001D16C4F7|nr:isochorismatase family cysteine hydrolase [Streptomyces sp. MA3_2.13]UED83339.1 cysteine hydrolase [Streptomyces sp. MA3_2.13]
MTRERITVPGRPEPYALTPARAAVLVVDMQNDFASPGGGIDVGGGDPSVVGAIVEPIAEVLAKARHAGIPVLHLQHGYRPDLADLGPEGSKNRLVHAAVGQPVPAPDGTEGRVLVHDTWNTRIVDRLTPVEGDHVLRKNRFSGFHDTALDATLRRLGVDDLIVTGCTTSVCVESTVRDAMFRDYRSLVLTDCVAEPQGRRHHDSTVALVENSFGWTARSEDLLGALTGR